MKNIAVIGENNYESTRVPPSRPEVVKSKSLPGLPGSGRSECLKTICESRSFCFLRSSIISLYFESTLDALLSLDFYRLRAVAFFYVYFDHSLAQVARSLGLPRLCLWRLLLGNHIGVDFVL